GDGAPGLVVEFQHEPDRLQGSSTYGEGTVHHVAFAVDNVDAQMRIKHRLTAMGHIDASESVNRNYFRSMYFKMPGGVMFEAATTDTGFATDREPGNSGGQFRLPPGLGDREPELLGLLEPISI